MRQIGNQCNLTISREFIAYLLHVSDERFSYVAHTRGKDVPFNLDVVTEIMGIPTLLAHSYNVLISSKAMVPNNDQLATFLKGLAMTWVGPHFNISDLAKNNKTLCLVIANAIDPTFHIQHLYRHHAIAIESIAHDKPLCFMRYVITKIGKI